MRSNISFDRFFREYIGKAVICSSVVMLCVTFIGILAFSADRSNQTYLKDLFAALEGKNIGDTFIKKDAEAIKRIVFDKREPDAKIDANVAARNRLKDIERVNNIKLNSNLDKIVSVVLGETQDFSNTIKIMPIRVFFFRFFIFWYLAFLMCCTFQFSIVSWNRNESLYDWPWNKQWTYWMFAFMLPGILLFGVFKGIFKHTREQTQAALDLSNLDGLVEEAAVDPRVIDLPEGTQGDYDPLNLHDDILVDERIDPLHYEGNRALQSMSNYLKEIEEAKKHIDETKKSWRKVFLKSAQTHTQHLQEESEKARNELSSAGLALTKAQKKFAEAEQALKDWHKQLNNIRERNSEDYAQELERIGKLDRVAAVKIQRDYLVVYTKTIYIHHGSRCFEMGAYEIHMPLYKGCSDILVRTLYTTHRQGRGHIYLVGERYCAGTLAPSIDEALQKKEFASAIEYLLEAMQSASGGKEQEVFQWKEVRFNDPIEE